MYSSMRNDDKRHRWSTAERDDDAQRPRLLQRVCAQRGVRDRYDSLAARVQLLFERRLALASAAIRLNLQLTLERVGLRSVRLRWQQTGPFTRYAVSCYTATATQCHLSSEC